MGENYEDFREVGSDFCQGGVNCDLQLGHAGFVRVVDIDKVYFLKQTGVAKTLSGYNIIEKTLMGAR